MTVIELVDAADPSQVRDTVTFDGDRISYATGEARSIVESRMRLIPDRAEMLASFDGWSNGYAATRLR